MLRFKCPKCETAYRALDGADGRDTVCRVCGHKFVAEVYNDLQQNQPPQQPETIPLAPIEEPPPKTEEITKLAAENGAAGNSGPARRIVVVRRRPGGAVAMVAVLLVGVAVATGVLWYKRYLTIPGVPPPPTPTAPKEPTGKKPGSHQTDVGGEEAFVYSPPGHTPATGENSIFDRGTGRFSDRPGSDKGTAQDSADRNGLKFNVDLEPSRPDTGHQVCVVGEIVNRKRRALRRLELRVSFLDDGGRVVGVANEVLTHLPVGMAAPVRIVLGGPKSEEVTTFRIDPRSLHCPPNIALWQIPGDSVSVRRAGNTVLVTGRATYFDAGSVKNVKIYCDLYIGNNRVATGEGRLLAKSVLAQGKFDTFMVRIPRVPRSGDLTAVCRAWAQRQ